MSGLISWIPVLLAQACLWRGYYTVEWRYRLGASYQGSSEGRLLDAMREKP